MMMAAAAESRCSRRMCSTMAESCYSRRMCRRIPPPTWSCCPRRTCLRPARAGSRSASCRLLPSPPLSPCLELGRTAVDAGLGLARAHHSSAKQIGRKPRKLARGKGSVVGASADGRQIEATAAPNVDADRCRQRFLRTEPRRIAVDVARRERPNIGQKRVISGIRENI